MSKSKLSLVLPVSKDSSCPKCKKSLVEICRDYPGSNTYRAEKLFWHMRDSHGATDWPMAVRDFWGIAWPTCPKTGKVTGHRVGGKGVFASTYSRGGATKETSSAVRKMCRKFSVERRGSNNPRYGKEPWNKGKSMEDDERLASVSKKLTGRRLSEKTRGKLSLARKRSPKQARHTMKHTEESKQKMREATAARHSRGEFSFARETSIEKVALASLRKMQREIGEDIGIQPQYVLNGFVFDFYIEKLGTLIECDGDFFHCNPQKYPGGPISAIQERNLRNDKRKNYVAKKSGYRLVRFWESEINSPDFFEKLCERLRSNQCEK